MSPTADDGLRRALEAAGVPLATFDREGHAISANEAFANLFYTAADSIVGRHLVGLCEDGHAPAVTSAFVRLIGGVSEAEVLDVLSSERRSRDLVRLTLAVGPASHGDEDVILCVATPLPNLQIPRVSQSEAKFTRLQSVRNDLDGRIESAINVSSHSGHPFGLLQCHFRVGSDSDGTGTAQMDEEMFEISLARLNQRLRSTDSVVLGPSGRAHVLAQSLGDLQDAAGVAYRLLSTMMEPVAVNGNQHSVHLTIGIAVADGASAVSQVLSAASEALEAAAEQGVGGFSIIDVRPGLAA